MFPTELIWEATKRNTCFLKKSNGFTLTREPFNLTNKHSLKYSGLAASKSIGMDLVENSNGKIVKKIVINKKNSGSSVIRCPKKFMGKVNVSNNVKCAKKTIKNQILSRKDLSVDAICKYKKLLKVRC
ncbi:60S ribosomal L28 [Cryptosporidium bovis]|uniref:60S ribosomal L28 n=1 Tax=Cryptosporidium bovis TaxID=310047 RepID=UPI00351A8D00|nr:60S ribosomal L28 [Cryptosporidium bovis]